MKANNATMEVIRNLTVSKKLSQFKDQKWLKMLFLESWLKVFNWESKTKK